MDWFVFFIGMVLSSNCAGALQPGHPGRTIGVGRLDHKIMTSLRRIQRGIRLAWPARYSPDNF
jgi:hypothetical protein